MTSRTARRLAWGIAFVSYAMVAVALVLLYLNRVAIDSVQTANVSNLLNKDPPYSAGMVGGANAVYFDALGRTYRVGMRMAF